MRPSAGVRGNGRTTQMPDGLGVPEFSAAVGKKSGHADVGKVSSRYFQIGRQVARAVIADGSLICVRGVRF